MYRIKIRKTECHSKSQENKSKWERIFLSGFYSRNSLKKSMMRANEQTSNLLEQLQGHLGGLPLMLAVALEVGKREYP